MCKCIIIMNKECIKSVKYVLISSCKVIFTTLGLCEWYYNFEL